ncbi:Agenet-like domain [Dillenia turbinata]|uniref:Agenet-like domain n=1 Tax=Dillenia turbinata TaxID=194707 RepID=A0AAN8YVY8_9MAGN
MENLVFQKGIEVEVMFDEEGFKGAWFAATIVKPPYKKKTKDNKRKVDQSVNYEVEVECRDLMSDAKGKKKLRETIDLIQIRPIPPREKTRSFELNEEVDAYFNDGWWEGVVTEVLEKKRYSVYFRCSREQMDFHESDLRLHREWVRGSWVPPLPIEDEKARSSLEGKCSSDVADEKFSNGMLVEVSSDEDGFQGAWFGATIVEAAGENKYLIEYKNLKTEDNKEFLREEIDSLHIRPCPPETLVIDRFNLLDEVDALYNDGWWVGVISKVLGRSKYLVYFRDTDEELQFDHKKLRPHQDWINGQWITASKV